MRHLRSCRSRFIAPLQSGNAQGSKGPDEEIQFVDLDQRRCITMFYSFKEDEPHHAACLAEPALWPLGHILTGTNQETNSRRARLCANVRNACHCCSSCFSRSFLSWQRLMQERPCSKSTAPAATPSAAAMRGGLT